MKTENFLEIFYLNFIDDSVIPYKSRVPKSHPSTSGPRDLNSEKYER